MSIVVAIIGVILTIAWIEQELTLRWRKRRERARARDKREMAHLVGARQWWKEPPGDGPEGDY